MKDEKEKRCPDNNNITEQRRPDTRSCYCVRVHASQVLGRNRGRTASATGHKGLDEKTWPLHALLYSQAFNCAIKSSWLRLWTSEANLRALFTRESRYTELCLCLNNFALWLDSIGVEFHENINSASFKLLIAIISVERYDSSGGLCF